MGIKVEQFSGYDGFIVVDSASGVKGELDETDTFRKNGKAVKWSAADFAAARDSFEAWNAQSDDAKVADIDKKLQSYKRLKVATTSTMSEIFGTSTLIAARTSSKRIKSEAMLIASGAEGIYFKGIDVDLLDALNPFGSKKIDEKKKWGKIAFDALKASTLIDATNAEPYCSLGDRLVDVANAGLIRGVAVKTLNIDLRAEIVTNLGHLSRFPGDARARALVPLLQKALATL